MIFEVPQIQVETSRPDGSMQLFKSNCDSSRSEDDFFEIKSGISNPFLNPILYHLDDFDTKCGQLQNLSQGSNTSHRDASEGAIKINISMFF